MRGSYEKTRYSSRRRGCIKFVVESRAHGHLCSKVPGSCEFMILYV